MPYQTLDQFNSTGVDGVLVYVAQTVPIFIPLTLFAILCIATLGTFFSQRRLTGRGSFASSFAAGSWFTAVVAIVMSLQPGLINSLTLTITILVSIVATVLLFLASDE